MSSEPDDLVYVGEGGEIDGAEIEAGVAIEAVEATGAPLAVPRRAVVDAVLRTVAFVVVLFLVYAFLPLNQSAVTTSAVIVLCTVGLGVFVVVFLRQLRVVARSPYPIVTGVAALVEVLAVFIVLFAMIHLAIADTSPAAYSEPLDRVAGVYFAVTVLTTVGFGDIAPVSSGARVATTIQMVADLFLVAAAARVIIGVARRSDARRKREQSSPAPPSAMG